MNELNTVMNIIEGVIHSGYINSELELEQAAASKKQSPSPRAVSNDPLSIDELINKALARCEVLPQSFNVYKQQIQELHSRLAHGRLHLAVVGEFNRGKSTFINSLIGHNLLPTSVLPITSVPTHIIYGRKISCKIAFLKDKPPIVVTTSPDAVKNALLKFVAEEHNPNNQFGVRSVEVSVPAPLLENGTVLIDTPGFGSTYLHNTQTALNSLTDCDAVLFLLSVDLPVTQTEIEFLKLVIGHVPRIFFILNKIDLLTSNSLDKVNRFIGEVIMDKLQPAIKPHIFTISAKSAEHATTRSMEDRYWNRSGMESVTNDIVSFMAREKYFTLSQALNDKLREAVSGIQKLLAQDLSMLEAPIGSLLAERSDISGETQNIKNTLEKELSIIMAEKKAIYKFFDETMSNGRIKLLKKIHDTTNHLLSGTSCSAESLRSVTIAINRVIPDALSTFKTQTIAVLNRPLKRAITLHNKEFTAALSAMHKCLSDMDSATDHSISDRLDALEIDTNERSESNVDQLPLNIKLLFSDHFFAREAKIKRLHRRYDHHIDDMVKNDLFAFSKHIRGRIDTLFSSLATLLTTEYELIVSRLEQYSYNKDCAIAAHKSRHSETIATLTAQIASFADIIDNLH